MFKLLARKISHYHPPRCLKLGFLFYRARFYSFRANIIGVDFGKTNSCIATIDDSGNPAILENDEGMRTTPSVVSFVDQECLVGITAKKAMTSPENIISETKYLIGRAFDDPWLQAEMERFPYKIVAGEKNNVLIETNNTKYSPSELAALIIRKMKIAAEGNLGHNLQTAIYTIPATFDENQKKAFSDTAKQAGLKALAIVPEPVAAAYAYGFTPENIENKLIGVYDLGGSFRFSILQADKGKIQVKATKEELFLGGTQFDAPIVDYLVKQFQKENRVDVSNDVLAIHRIREAAETAKLELSSSLSCHISLPFLTATATGPKHLTTKLTRVQFSLMVDQLIHQTLLSCESCLNEANIQKSELSEVILVGGMTKIQAVVEAVQKFFEKEPRKIHNTDEVMAMGAAVYGRVLLQGDYDASADSAVTLATLPYSLKVETYGGLTKTIVERGTALPCTISEIFSTPHDDQKDVEIKIFMGERERAQDNVFVGQLNLTNFPEAPRHAFHIEVEIQIDTEGLVQVEAIEEFTFKGESLEFNLADYTRNIADTVSENYAEEDAKTRALIEARNEAEFYIYSIEKGLTDFQRVLSSKEKTRLQECSDRLKEVIQTEDRKQILLVLQEVQDVWDVAANLLDVRRDNYTIRKNMAQKRIRTGLHSLWKKLEANETMKSWRERFPRKNNESSKQE